MTQGQQQRAFTKMVARLILWAYDNGYEMTFGEAFRPDWVAAEYERRGIGIRSSYHTVRLAVDMNLFRNGVYLTNTEDYRAVGEAWEAYGGVWGGRFKKKDGNHFSLGEGSSKAQIAPKPEVVA